MGLTSYAQQQQQQEIKIFATGADGAAHELNLRAIKQNNGQIQKVSTFKIQTQNVVQINLGNDIAIFTDPVVQIDKVKVRDQSNKLTELGKITNNNIYSLAGFPTGVYALDVIIDNRAYETILVM
jgi:hypothetical protein